jgi:hypothetical protein
LGLREAEPPPENLLVQGLAEHMEVSMIVAICSKDASDVLARKSGTELVALEKVRRVLGGRGAELIPLVSMAPTTQARGVVGGQDGSAALAMTTSITVGAGQSGTGRAHRIPSFGTLRRSHAAPC